MIIHRRYATYGQMLQDKNAKEIIINALCESSKKYTYDEAVELLEADSWVIIQNTDMGSLIPADAYQNIIKNLDILDESDPYDNGLTYRDVTGIQFYPSRKGNALLQILYSKKFEQPLVIVQVIAFEHNGQTINPIEPWYISTISI